MQAEAIVLAAAVTVARRLLRYPATTATALLCLVIFVVEVGQDPSSVLLGRPTELEVRFSFIGLLVPYEPWRVLTGPLLHGAPWHLLNNVFFLLLLGSWLEEDVGQLRWTVVFIAGVIASEAIIWIVDPSAQLIGVSGGLMALAAAGIRLERESPFASERRRLCALTIGVTLLLGLAAPKVGSLSAHAAGALTGFLLTFVLPPPLGIRSQRAAEMSKKAEQWAVERAGITGARLDERQLDLRPTLAWRAGLTLAAVLFVGLGASTALQMLTIHDRLSAIGAAGVGISTAMAGVFIAIHESLRYYHGNPVGLTGFRWHRTVKWTEVGTFYPGTVYSGLFMHEAIGFELVDGTAFGIPALGHHAKPIARRLEAIRIAIVKPSVTP